MPPTPPGNYRRTLLYVILTVNHAPLTLRAATARRSSGDVNPAFTGAIAGLKNSDAITATYTSSARPDGPAGGYATLPTAVYRVPITLGNYLATLDNGTRPSNHAPLSPPTSNPTLSSCNDT